MHVQRLEKQLRDYVQSTTGVELFPDRLIIGFARRFATYKRKIWYSKI